MIDPPPHLYVHGPGIDEPLGVKHGNGSRWYYHSDGLGSVLAATDVAGVVSDTRKYDAFGNLQVGEDEDGYAYTGREWDPETGLYYYRARYYDPKIGRFISEDPLRYIDGPNLYQYVGGNPVVRIDPGGTEWSMNMTELNWCRSNPIACAVGSSCGAWTNIVTSFALDDQGPDGPGNAWKHCVLSCCLVRNIGMNRAWEMTINHEANQRAQSPCASQMDMRNNMIGLALGQGNRWSNCLDLCTTASKQCAPRQGPPQQCWQP